MTESAAVADADVHLDEADEEHHDVREHEEPDEWHGCLTKGMFTARGPDPLVPLRTE
jgi:hypothetical protein